MEMMRTNLEKGNKKMRSTKEKEKSAVEKRNQVGPLIYALNEILSKDIVYHFIHILFDHSFCFPETLEQRMPRFNIQLSSRFVLHINIIISP